EIGLREVRVEFYLVDGRGDSGGVDEFGEHRLGEVRDADGLDQPALAQFDESAPGVDVLADAGIGPMDEVQVEVVEAEPGQGLLGAGDGFVESVVTAGDLRGDEQLLAVDGGVRD